MFRLLIGVAAGHQATAGGGAQSQKSLPDRTGSIGSMFQNQLKLRDLFQARRRVPRTLDPSTGE